MLEPELPKAKEDVAGLAVDIDDEILYAIYPVTGKRFLKWKYGKETPPPEVLPRTLEDVAKEDELVKKARAGELFEKPEKEIPEKGENIRTFNVFVEDDYYEVAVESLDGAPMVSYVQAAPAQAAAPAGVPSAPAAPAPAAPAPAAAPPTPPPAPAKPVAAAPATPAPTAAASADGTPMTAPMPGMIVSIEKNVGDAVKKGDTVVVLEAMKMENSLPAPVDGTIQAIQCKQGDSVAKGATLCVIG